MEVPTERDGITRATSAKYKPNKRRARVLIDKRSVLGRRVKELVQGIPRTHRSRCRRSDHGCGCRACCRDGRAVREPAGAHVAW